MNRQKSKKNNYNGDNETARRNPSLDLPEWLEEFTENLVDESVPAHRDTPPSSSRESALEPRRREVSDKHIICIQFQLVEPCNVVAQLVTSQPVAAHTTVTFFSHSDVLGPSRNTRK